MEELDNLKELELPVMIPLPVGVHTDIKDSTKSHYGSGKGNTIDAIIRHIQSKARKSLNRVGLIDNVKGGGSVVGTSRILQDKLPGGDAEVYVLAFIDEDSNPYNNSGFNKLINNFYDRIRIKTYTVPSVFSEDVRKLNMLLQEIGSKADIPHILHNIKSRDFTRVLVRLLIDQSLLNVVVNDIYINHTNPEAEELRLSIRKVSSLDEPLMHVRDVRERQDMLRKYQRFLREFIK